MSLDRTPSRALMRRVPDSYAPFYRSRGIMIGAPEARAQHAAYAEALRASGLEVHYVEADEVFPDCVFVEDPAVVWPPGTLIGRLAPHRDGEQGAVAEALRRWHALEELPDGARLEGGDVLHAGDTTYVGLTDRTNERGVGALREFLDGRRVIAVPVGRHLHLKTAVTYLGDDTIVAAPEGVSLDLFDVGHVVRTAPGELGAANCIRIRDRLLIPGGYPGTEARLRDFAERHDLEVVPLGISEFEKGEGSLTCLSIIW